VDWTRKYGESLINLIIEDAESSDTQKLRSITVLQNALGLGIHERFREVVSMRRPYGSTPTKAALTSTLVLRQG
jgi:hypothetical protein